jgi:hypothetical protein
MRRAVPTLAVVICATRTGVLVPAEATSELSAHGFVPVANEATAAVSRKNRRGAIVS